MLERRSRLKIKIDAIQRYLLWHKRIPFQNNIYVSEFPKSGGTWLCQLLCFITGHSFPRNSPVLSRSAILHSHLLPTHRQKKPIYVVRDGRDVIISSYFHFLVENNHCPPNEREKWRNRMDFSDFDNCAKNIDSFLQVFHSTYSVGLNQITWKEHVEKSLKHDNVLIIKYEDLLSEPLTVLIKACQHLSIDYVENQISAAIEKYSFKNQKKKNPTFLRKGLAGDWKNYFNQKTRIAFDQIAGDTLIKLGYENNRHWIKSAKN